MIDLTLEQMQMALENAGICTDPSKWDGDTINRAGVVLQQAYIAKLQRAHRAREEKEQRYAAERKRGPRD